MKILIACEESQTICKALRAKGHEAYSCDIIDSSGGHPEWHIKDDAIKVSYDLSYGWEAMIGHPPCTFITNSGVRWLYNNDGSKNEDRWDKLKDACTFFKALLDAPINIKAIENPIPHKHALNLIGKKYNQIVQPYMFGEPESKATCLWLEGLPKLMETNNVKDIWKELPNKEAQRIHYMSPGKDRDKLRSKTFKGISDAIANQWFN